ncbi:MAG: hydroxyacid dehydrogenase [Chloroflexota bacterium]|nr:hydroxyacid dehydrogenase [Chloroflexota bacterium]
MQALITAYLEEAALTRLHEVLELTPGGALVHQRSIEPDELIRELAGIPILIVGYEQVTEAVMDACPDLALISSIRGGPEANISIAAATERGIPVLYTVGRTDHAVAEYTFALMLAIARHVTDGYQLVTERVITHPKPYDHERDVIWRLPPGSESARIRARLTGVELYRKTLGLIGFGNIGRHVAKLGQAFGMRVVVADPFIDPARAREAGVELVDLPDLMAQADFVSPHARVTPQSTGVVGRAELARMKPTAYLVNTARAALIDEDALIETLREGRIAGAALDVFHREPLPPDYPLLDLPNVILTPHLAGSTREIPTHHSDMVADDVVAYLHGEIPTGHVANPAVFDRATFRARGARVFGAAVR